MKTLTIYDDRWEGIKEEFIRFANKIKSKYDLILWIDTENDVMEIIASKYKITVSKNIPSPDDDVFSIVDKFLIK